MREEMYTPDVVFDKLRKCIIPDEYRKTAKTIGITVLLTALLCYFYMAVLGYSGPDSIIEGVYYYSNKETAITMGRWIVYLINDIVFRNVVIPPLNIFLYCLMISFSVFFLCRMFEIKETGFQILLTALFVSFHVVVHHFAYMYMAVYFALSFLLSVMAVWFIAKKGLKNFAVGTGLILLMVGTYQAYIGAVAALTIIVALDKCLQSEPIKESLRFLGKSILAGILACVLNMPIMAFFIRINGYTTSDRVAENPALDVINNLNFSIPYSYKWFFSFFNDDVLSRKYLYMALGLLIVVLIIYRVERLLKAKKIVSGALTVCLVLLLPLTMNICQVLFPHNAISDRMRYQYVLLAVLLFALLKKHTATLSKAVAEWVTYLTVLLLVLTNIVSANASSLCYKLAYENTYTQAVQITSKVYELEEYIPGETKILFGGAIDYQTTYDSHAMLFRYAHMEPGPVFWGGMYGATASRYSYLMDFLGVNAGWITDSEYQYIISTDDYAKMPVWPKKGSVQMLGDYAVVKLTENP